MTTQIITADTRTCTEMIFTNPVPAQYKGKMISWGIQQIRNTLCAYFSKLDCSVLMVYHAYFNSSQVSHKDNFFQKRFWYTCTRNHVNTDPLH